jgi:hypothetical protein
MPRATFAERFATLFSAVMGRLADGLLRPLVGSFSALLLLGLPFDTCAFLQHPHEYAIGQHLDITQPHWLEQYVLRNFLLFAAAGLTLWLIVASYFKPSRPLLRLSCRSLVTALFAIGVFNFYQSAVNGFDH